MAEKESVYNLKIRHVGMFDFKETYRVMFEWLLHEGYDVFEKEYKEIIGQNGAKEVDVFWDATKKVSDYFKFWINVRFHPLAMTSVEVDVDGVKQKMNKGDFTIEFKSALLKDTENKWAGNDFLRFLRKNYDKYLIRERTEKSQIKLIAELESFVEYAKDFLALAARRPTTNL
jgi:hypothetical protein